MIQAMIFDMDGVLFDTEQILKDGWMDTGKKMGFTLGERGTSSNARWLCCLGYCAL